MATLLQDLIEDYCKLWYAHIGRLPLCSPEDEPLVRRARALLARINGSV